MNLIKKVFFKLNSEFRFLIQQKWGLIKPNDRFVISKSVLKKILPSDPIIIDCGAHVGADSVELSRVFPKGRIHSFEPVPEIYKSLLSNTKKFDNISTYPVALGTINGNSEMFVSSGSSDASSSLLEPTGHKDSHPDVYFNDKITVEVKTLKEWASIYKIDHIDFLWLDMQGFELQMLKASEEILAKVKCIHTEVSLKETYHNAVHYSEYRKWLEQKGFSVLIEAWPVGADMGNVLFVRK